MKAIECTGAHKREALRRSYELAAELSAVDRSTLLADALARAALGACRDLGRFSALLSTVGYDAARIEREVRRVDGLATGRLVRETVWAACFVDGSRSRALDFVTAGNVAESIIGRARVRVTRIRRAP